MFSRKQGQTTASNITKGGIIFCNNYNDKYKNNLVNPNLPE